MGNFLSAPKTEKDSTIHELEYGTVASSAMQGWRREMEDQHIVRAMPSLGDHILLAVFDGHCGKGAAIYAEQHLISVIESTEEWKQYVDSGDERTPASLGAALSVSFLRIDEMMRPFQNGINGQDDSGCTAVVVMVTPTHFVCSNAGDSRSVLGTNGTTIPLSEDHKPCNKIERKRIVNAGGVVQMGRVDGELAVSRALGDFRYKERYDLHASLQKVTALPDIKIVQRSHLDEVLILACDGLWDVFSSEEGVQQVRELWAAGETDMALVVEEILDQSLLKGSRDNISAVVMRLPGSVTAQQGQQQGEGIILARRAERLKEKEYNENKQREDKLSRHSRNKNAAAASAVVNAAVEAEAAGGDGNIE